MIIRWTVVAAKQLKRLPIEQRQRIADKMSFWFAQNDPFSFGKVLQGNMKDHVRFRVGAYRVIVVRIGTVASVLRVADRKDAYR